MVPSVSSRGKRFTEVIVGWQSPRTSCTEDANWGRSYIRYSFRCFRRVTTTTVTHTEQNIRILHVTHCLYPVGRPDEMCRKAAESEISTKWVFWQWKDQKPGGLVHCLNQSPRAHRLHSSLVYFKAKGWAVYKRGGFSPPPNQQPQRSHHGFTPPLTPAEQLHWSDICHFLLTKGLHAH